jgi:threonyl-tRNA synthetase
MKILSLHCDYIKFKPVKKALKEPEKLSKEQEKEKEIKECLVIFTAVEKGDSPELASKLVENVEDIAKQVKAKRVVLYPYAHLSSNLSSPEIAISVLKEAEHELKKNKKYDVVRAPFGYYKEFELRCKGHPLAELSREIKADGKEGKVEEKELGENERANLLKMMTKTRASFERSKDGKKSNAEIGRELDLYVASEIIGSGLPLLTPKGATILREMERFITDTELKRGYEHTRTPVLAKSDLYKISGHWQHYRDSMFSLDVGGETFALRPMTCPFQFIIYKSKPRSYKELPVKYAEISQLFRNEKSGELMGLTRLRQFTLSDAHIICTPEQLEEQFAEVLDLVKYTMTTFGIEDVWYRFSKWEPKNKKKYIDNPKAWEDSQKSMKKILDKLKLKYVEAEDEAAFYGPKLDIQYKNIFGKEDTLITIQIDFALPERFELEYTDKDNKSKRPMIIHRSSIGCFERTLAYLLEKTQGSLATWLSPIQARVISFTDRNINSCKTAIKEIAGKIPQIRIDADFRDITVNAKIRDAEMQKIPYILVIGDKEEEKKTLAVRRRGMDPEFGVKPDNFISEIKKEIDERKS